MNGVECTRNPACDVSVIGSDAAENAPIACSGAACTVNCQGSSVCQQGITSDAAICQLTCNGSNARAERRVQHYDERLSVMRAIRAIAHAAASRTTSES